jgi:hypothetical protein
MIAGWNILNMLMPGKSANNFDLPTNCYYCTAAALQNKTCTELVKDSELMQFDTGKSENFKELFSYALTHKEYTDLGVATSELLAELPRHQAVAFGYNRVNGTGHMIVVFKAMTSIGSSGSVATAASGYLRHIDYQTQNPQPGDGMLPAGESASGMTGYHIFYPT